MPSYENLETGEIVLEFRDTLPGVIPPKIVAVTRDENGTLYEGDLGYLFPVSE